MASFMPRASKATDAFGSSALRQSGMSSDGERRKVFGRACARVSQKNIESQRDSNTKAVAQNCGSALRWLALNRA